MDDAGRSSARVRNIAISARDTSSFGQKRVSEQPAVMPSRYSQRIEPSNASTSRNGMLSTVTVTVDDTVRAQFRPMTLNV